MDKMLKEGVILERKKAQLKHKIALIGFPGMAYVGKGVADYIVSTLGLELEVTIHPFHSPANVIVNDGMIIAPSIYIYTRRDANVAVVTSSYQPQSDEGQNAVAHMLLGYLAEKKVLGVLSAAAYVTSSPSKPRKVYAASTSRELLNKLVSLGLIPMEGGISGLNGLVPSLAQLYGLPGAVLLGETSEVHVAGNIIDYLAIASVLDVIIKLTNISLDIKDLVKKGEEIEEKITTQVLKEIEEGEKPATPTHL